MIVPFEQKLGTLSVSEHYWLIGNPPRPHPSRAGLHRGEAGCGAFSTLHDHPRERGRKERPSQTRFPSSLSSLSPSPPPVPGPRTELVIYSPYPRASRSRHQPGSARRETPAGRRAPPLTPTPEASPIAGSGAQFAAPASRAGQILVPCPGPPMEMRTPPCSRLQPATQLRHTKPHTHICGRGGVRANSPGTREGRGRRGRVGGTGWDPAAQVRARRRPGRSLTR